MRGLRVAGWVTMTLLALAMAFLALRYFFAGTEHGFQQQREVYDDHLGQLLLHVGGASVALVVGPFQLWTRLRNRHLALHRALGRVYCTAVLFGGIGGLLMAPMAYGGLPSRMGFALLAVCWLGTCAMALAAARGRRIPEHRDWMLRCYALTFAAVTLRLWLPLLQMAGSEFEPAYVTVAWLSWVPNLLVVEWVITRRRGLPASAPA